jgi:hypothetical protein
MRSVMRLGILEGIGGMGALYSQLLAARGERDEAITVLRRGRGALIELGQDQAAAQVSEPLATVGTGPSMTRIRLLGFGRRGAH